MLVILPYIKLVSQIDTLKSLADSALNIQQVQSAQMDSVCNATTLLADGQETLLGGIDSIQVQTITDYGVGYSDVLAHITLPLIVALLAFAFPFLFTVISHINNKYESEYTTDLFSSEPTYKWFLRGAAISAGYLVVAGILSLCLDGKAHGVFAIVLNWTSVIVAGGYAAIILLFVRTCLDYNNPQRVMERIDHWYDHYTKKAKGNQFGNYSAGAFRIRRLVELCRYSIRKQDNALFQSVIYKVNTLPHQDEKSVYHNFVFFEDVAESYMYSPYNSKIEDTLMMYWLMTYNKSETPNRGFIYRMLGKMVEAVKQGKFSLFEVYWNNARHGFRFIEDLPVISYVGGRNVQEQKKAETGARSTLREMCEMHYLAFAYLFSEGYTDIVKLLLNNDIYSGYRMLPGKGVDVLKMYAMCKKRQMPGGRFSYMMSDDVIGENTDPEMLEKFAAMLLLTASPELEDYMCLVKDDHLKTIIAAKEKLVKYGKMWQNDEELGGQYPQIKSVDVAKLLQGYLKRIDKVSRAKNIYKAQLDEEIKEKIDAAYLNMLYGNQGYVLEGLVGADMDTKVQTLLMGSYTYTSYKQMFTEKWDIDYNLELFDQARVFQSRYLFMVYTAIKNMHIVEEKVLVTDLGKWIEDYMQGKGEEYIVIETGSASLLLMDLDHSDSRGSNYWTFKKAAYRHYDLTTSWYMKDVEEVKSFDNTVIVMKKKDLPYVQCESETYGPHVIYEDESNEKEAEVVVRITVNPNLMARYSENTAVVRIKIQK